MKFFKCGKCQKPFKIDETKIKSPIVSISCSSCSTKNTLRFGIFLLVQNKEELIEVPLKKGGIILSRSNANKLENYLYINDKFVSRKHAIIEVKEKEGKFSIFVKDLNSTNGTYDKNKNKIHPEEEIPFLKNDYFIIGLTKVSLKFY
jgi:hypothetical protein